MNRAFNDNALLDIARLRAVDRIYKGIGVGALSAMAIGCVWFLCVAVPAKALWQ
jgi:hypothetical protein